MVSAKEFGLLFVHLPSIYILPMKLCSMLYSFLFVACKGSSLRYFIISFLPKKPVNIYKRLSIYYGAKVVFMFSI